MSSGFLLSTRSSPISSPDLGKLLLMFFAGLEIDLDLFRRARIGR